MVRIFMAASIFGFGRDEIQTVAMLQISVFVLHKFMSPGTIKLQQWKN